MKNQTVRIVSHAIRYMEEHLHEKPDLDQVAAALHYSKYHLHRIFTKTVGLTIHDYAKRRCLTEAARLLAFSQKPILEIALLSGYESQQAFTDVFKAMYKVSPAKFREAQEFYPLQLEICLHLENDKVNLTKDDVKFATPFDMDDWMDLVRFAIDGYPRLKEAAYMDELRRHIARKEALILREEGRVVGAMGFSVDRGSIDFLAVHPQRRRFGIAKLFVDKLTDGLLRGREIALTTYRAGDRADTGYRREYERLGFMQRELLVEYGYPAQRFCLPPKSKEGFGYA